MSATTPARTVADPAGVEDPVAVFVSEPWTDEEGTTWPASICLDHQVDLGVEQARAVAQRLLQLADAASWRTGRACESRSRVHGGSSERRCRPRQAPTPTTSQPFSATSCARPSRRARKAAPRSLRAS